MPDSRHKAHGLKNPCAFLYRLRLPAWKSPPFFRANGPIIYFQFPDKQCTIKKGEILKYRVRVSELRYGDVEIEAESEEQAKTIASGKEIEWFDSEITDMITERID